MSIPGYLSCVVIDILILLVLAPPRVTFHPHLEAGIYHVQENRSASLECIIEEGTYPAVTNITTSVATSVMGLREMENTGAFPPYCLSAMLYSTQRAAVEDSGEYSCIVNSGGLVTIHTVYLKVQSKLVLHMRLLTLTKNYLSSPICIWRSSSY